MHSNIYNNYIINKNVFKESLVVIRLLIYACYSEVGTAKVIYQVFKL